MITDRTRFSVIEMNTNRILSTDLIVKEPVVSGQLSAPSIVNFKISYGEASAGFSAEGIEWKSWGQWIITEMEVDNVYRVVACTIVTDAKVDPASYDMVIESKGFSDYPRGIPWLENWNDIAVDPFEVVQRIYSHVQSTSNSNLGIEVLPASSGTQMLPGYGFDGSILVFDFFALFVRAVDFPDSGDYVTGLARDIPFDYIEECEWTPDRKEVLKTFRMYYPGKNVRQEHLSFRLGENVMSLELAEEKDIEWVSDVIIRGWFPGKVYSSRLSNADLTRARRTILEEDAKIDSTERAAAWGKRKLQRRNVPKYWQKATINPNDDNGQFGQWELGDSIFVEGDYPWIGEIAEWHRIMSWTYDESKGTMELGLKVEGAFNYDPIEYDPDAANSPIVDHNLLTNGYFNRNLAGWRADRGAWFRMAGGGYDTEGRVRVDCDDAGERFISHKITVTPGVHMTIQGAVMWSDLETSGPGETFALKVLKYLNGGYIGEETIDATSNPAANHTWEPLRDLNWIVPTGINEIAIQLTVNPLVTDAVAYWDDIKVLVNV